MGTAAKTSDGEAAEQLEWLQRLESDGFLRRERSCHRTTRRWQAAMARAALQLLTDGDEADDLRVPIALALFELYGDRMTTAEIAGCIDAITPIEAAELAPELRLEPAR